MLGSGDFTCDVMCDIWNVCETGMVCLSEVASNSNGFFFEKRWHLVSREKSFNGMGVQLPGYYTENHLIEDIR